MGTVDWPRVFLPDQPIVEIVARGSATYLALFFLLRFIVKREAGTLAITDVLARTAGVGSRTCAPPTSSRTARSA